MVPGAIDLQPPAADDQQVLVELRAVGRELILRALVPLLIDLDVARQIEWNGRGRLRVRTCGQRHHDDDDNERPSSHLRRQRR